MAFENSQNFPNLTGGNNSLANSQNSVIRKSSIIDEGSAETPMEFSDSGENSLEHTIQKIFFGKIVNILQV